MRSLGLEAWELRVEQRENHRGCRRNVSLMRRRGGGAGADLSLGEQRSSMREFCALDVFPTLSELGTRALNVLPSTYAPRSVHVSLSSEPSSSLTLSLSQCEALEPPITSPDGYHTSSHILLKINIPVAEDLILGATDRARAMSREGGSSLQRRRMSSPRGRYRDHGHDRDRDPDRHARPPIEYERWYAARQQDPYGGGGGPSPLPPHFFGPPPPHYFGGAQGPNWLPPPPPPPPNYHPAAPAGQAGPIIMRAHPRAAEVQSQVVHGVRCRACRKGIQGIRWTCANCGTTPTFDLVSSERRGGRRKAGEKDADASLPFTVLVVREVFAYSA